MSENEYLRKIINTAQDMFENKTRFRRVNGLLISQEQACYIYAEYLEQKLDEPEAENAVLLGVIKDVYPFTWKEMIEEKYLEQKLDRIESKDNNSDSHLKGVTPND